MAYDEELASRIREVVRGEDGLTEKRMFGGLAFLVGGNMAVGVSGQGGLMIRCDHGETQALASEPGAGQMVMREREMKGWVRVTADAVEDDDVLMQWVRRGTQYAGSLPPK